MRASTIVDRHGESVDVRVSDLRWVHGYGWRAECRRQVSHEGRRTWVPIELTQDELEECSERAESEECGPDEFDMEDPDEADRRADQRAVYGRSVPGAGVRRWG